MTISGQKLFIGLMSGTSIDAIDAALVQLEPEFRIVATHSTPISDQLKRDILSISLPGDNEIDRMAALDDKIAELFAQAANQLLANNGIPANQITAIGSHGQTIRHRPESGFTLQLGDASRIAELTGITTVSNFRQRDLAAGGQGAPLVPAFHQALFQKAGTERFILNIGGIANITHLPADKQSRVTGFDTGPGNMLMDSWIQQHQKRAFDAEGAWARTGKCNPSLLSSMLDHPYFEKTGPKSTGRELFNLSWLEQHLPAEANTIKAEDVQATLLQLTAQSITDAIRATQTSENFALYVCGGGAKNTALLDKLKQQLPGNSVGSTEDLGLNPEWVEAAAFAWLAARCLQGQPGNLPDVTGASGSRILGAIHPA